MASIAHNAHTRRADRSTDSWITPEALIRALGPFDLDPCAATPQPWPCARRSYCLADDCLSRRWAGLVWLNPPYGRALGRWLARMAAHGNGIALVFARTDTAAFVEHVWPHYSALFFLAGRLTFYRPDGQPGPHDSGGPSVLIAYGQVARRRLTECNLAGHFVAAHSAAKGQLT